MSQLWISIIVYLLISEGNLEQLLLYCVFWIPKRQIWESTFFFDQFSVRFLLVYWCLCKFKSNKWQNISLLRKLTKVNAARNECSIWLLLASVTLLNVSLPAKGEWGVKTGVSHCWGGKNCKYKSDWGELKEWLSLGRAGDSPHLVTVNRELWPLPLTTPSTTTYHLYFVGQRLQKGCAG